MRDCDLALEQEFFRIFADYYDLEKNTGRKYSDGEYTLDRMCPLAEAGGFPEQRLKIVHVAGTKGKGSTAFFLSALLTSCGLRCGTFTSPHLATVRERFQIDNRPVPYADLLRESTWYEARLRELELEPTLFEIMTVLSMRLFVAGGCEWAVLETGIGGTLDSTNYVRHPACTIISPVSFDHMQLLGSTIAEIAGQKAGIIKPGVPVVCARQPYEEALAVVRVRASEVGADIHEVALHRTGRWGDLDLADFQRENLDTALTVCGVLGMVPEPKRFVMPQLRGRFEKLSDCPLVIVDAAHNADSARQLVKALHSRYPGTRFRVVLGVVKGKDTEGIVSELGRLDAQFILTNPRPPKESDLPKLIGCAREHGLRYTVCEEILSGDDIPPGGEPLLFTGSFFTALIGEECFGSATR